MTQYEGFPFFLILLELFMPISKCRQNDGHDRSYLGVESCKSTGGSIMKWLLLYLKMKCTKNNEKTMKHL